ncbi:PREDICTED: glu S.griseus protease inhibitor-like [Camelina sativa]|uniref:Glu S.griseus protease inhibitor-like n=1 Tax=Camelina sativa TaxID=90675 RepID=A0ABM1RU41_CAMSA|nr:PREDICTED: glu S.griseus protease inhibitor-like [Camelina sativa]
MATHQSCPYIGKNSWPELLGTNGDYASSVIKGENSSLQVTVILVGSPVTGDLRCDRVRVWVDESRIVVKNPTAG